ncbi:hypothetical protein QQS21_009513 [Conoideocrella luteorostrata]|uniref:Uncharacterized protein n=1 Tax=Conoideocrella luteorostrata TaxID=1105319 RepID=A0AAJ0FXP9_9HYPO|nr:hypothetical protein QQS21_009513 [Conoideocrella luteorostrata]
MSKDEEGGSTVIDSVSDAHSQASSCLIDIRAIGPEVFRKAREKIKRLVLQSFKVKMVS